MTQGGERPGQQRVVTLLELLTVFSSAIAQPKSTTTTDAFTSQSPGIGSQAKQASLSTWQGSRPFAWYPQPRPLASSKGETGRGNQSMVHLTAML